MSEPGTAGTLSAGGIATPAQEFLHL